MAPTVEMRGSVPEVLEEVESNFTDDIERDSVASDNEDEAPECTFLK